jgi:hypothetical protein
MEGLIMPITHIGGRCVNTTSFSTRGRSKVNAKGFDISQPNHVRLVNEALRNANGGIINLKLGRFAD